MTRLLILALSFILLAIVQSCDSIIPNNAVTDDVSKRNKRAVNKLTGNTLFFKDSDFNNAPLKFKLDNIDLNGQYNVFSINNGSKILIPIAESTGISIDIDTLKTQNLPNLYTKFNCKIQINDSHVFEDITLVQDIELDGVYYYTNTVEFDLHFKLPFEPRVQEIHLKE